METRSPRQPRVSGERRPEPAPRPTDRAYRPEEPRGPDSHTSARPPDVERSRAPSDEPLLGGLDERRIVKTRPGSSYVRIVRRFSRQFHRQEPGYFVATERALAPRGFLGRLGDQARKLLIGRRVPTHMEATERVGVLKGLALFASDNI